MGQEDKIVYAEEVLAFVAIANAFTQFIEQPDAHSLTNYVDSAHKLLPELYFRATQLPKVSSEFEEFNQRFVTEEDYEYHRSRLLNKFGQYDTFEEVFDPNRLEAEEYVGESISENLTDIYQDIKDFVLLYQIGSNEVMYEALWELRQSFENYWGQKLVNTLRAVHQLRFSPEELDENGSNQNENTIFKNPDTSNWFLSRRQEDFRDE